jgi:putative transposase
LRPERKQRHQVGRFAGSCRFVFNRALALQKEWFELSGAHAGYADLCAVLVDWKQDKETDWLNEAPSQGLQQSLKNLDARVGTTLGLVEEAETGPNQTGPTDARAGVQEEGKARQLSLSAGDLSGTKQQRIGLPKLGWVRYVLWTME